MSEVIEADERTVREVDEFENGRNYILVLFKTFRLRDAVGNIRLNLIIVEINWFQIMTPIRWLPFIFLL